MDFFKKLTGLKTLLIDDNEIVRDTLAMVFAYKKCFIKAVASAEEGLRALEEEGFDIIICDFGLPGINGTEFFRQVMAAYPDTVKVLISGYAVESTIAQALETGVDAFLKKPFSLFALLEQLAPLAEKYQAAKHSPHHMQEKKTTVKTINSLKPQEKIDRQNVYEVESTAYQGIGCRSRKKLPVGPPSGRVANQTGVSAPCSGDNGA